jgi:hypothetical protein
MGTDETMGTGRDEAGGARRVDSRGPDHDEPRDASRDESLATDRDQVGARDEVTEPRRDVVDTEARWAEAQARFVDAPREAVGAADELIRDVVDAIARRLDRDREEVAGLWNDDSDTETLRSVMLRYREVLDRLERRTS